MEKRRINNIVMLGSGNVASHLGLHLHKTGHNIVQVYSRTPENSEILAKQVNAETTSTLSAINTHADLYILAVTDDVIKTIASNPMLKNKTLVHTAGSVPASILSPYTKDFGAFYPFQTFSIGREVDFKTIPVLIEASNSSLLSALKEVGETLSDCVIEAGSEQRAMLHISAVFACNFTNHMYAIADELLKNSKLPFELMLPLIQETASKIRTIPPQKAQTGPAVRGDKHIIENHLKMLSTNPEAEKLYKLISSNIQNFKIKTDG